MSSVRPSLTRPLLFLLAMLVAVLSGPSSGYAQDDGGNEKQIAAVQSKLDQAVARVKAIVNQPVSYQTRTPYMDVAVFGPGWFHEGAEVPDFANVDIRATQDLLYSKYQYVASDLNPGAVYFGVISNSIRRPNISIPIARFPKNG